MTGFTSRQVNAERRTISYVDVTGSAAEAMRELGHEVDWRKVEPGEDLSQYDVIWVSMAPLNSLNGRMGAMGALWALASGKPAIGFFDDWQFHAVFNGARSLVRHPEALYKYMLVGAAHRGDENATYFSRDEAMAALERVKKKNPEADKKCYVERYYMCDTDETVRPVESTLLESAEGLLGRRWAAGMVPVCPMYAWGDRAPVRKRMPEGVGPIEALDPSPTTYSVLASCDTVVPPEEKNRSWVLGALMPHDDWLARKSPTWPVEIVGSRKLIRKFGGQRFQTEEEVLAFYNQHWGILSPPYSHAGSGWFRARFIYAARTKSVLFTDKGEGDPLGDAYKVPLSVIENMSTVELSELAEYQANSLRPYMPSYDSFVAHIERIVERAVREDRGR